MSTTRECPNELVKPHMKNHVNTLMTSSTLRFLKHILEHNLVLMQRSSETVNSMAIYKIRYIPSVTLRMKLAI